MAIPKVKVTFDSDLSGLKKGTQEATTNLEKFGEKVADFSKKAALAFAAAGAAVTAYGVSAAKAAAADEQSRVRLENQLRSFTNATTEQIAANSKFIDQLSIQTAITDDKLRPSMERFARSLGDVQAAQQATELSARVSVNTGKDIETVTNAMAKAADGNTTSLARLGLGFTAAELKGKDFNQIVTMLNEKFPDLGTNAETSAFKFAQMKIAMDEAKESIGASLLPVMNKLVSFVTVSIVPALDAFSRGMAGKGGITDSMNSTEVAAYNLGSSVQKLVKSFDNLFYSLDSGSQSSFAVLMGWFNWFIRALDELVQGTAKAIAITRELLNPSNFFKSFDEIQTKINLSFARPSMIPAGALGGGGSIGGAGTGGLTSAIAGLGSAASSLGGLAGGGGSGGGNAAAQAALAKLQSDFATVQTLAEIATSPTFTNEATNIRENARATYYLNVTGAIDPEGTARTIVNTLNNSYYRGTGGAGNLIND